MRRRSPAAIAALLGVFTFTACATQWPQAAWADAPSAQNLEHAKELKKRADALMDEFNYADAYALYAEAYSTSADPAILYNEGRVLEAMGDYPRALARLEQFAQTAPPDVRALIPALDQLIADVRSRVSVLVVKCNVAGARVLVRDQMVGTVRGTAEIPVRAGKATIELVADGYEPFHKDLELPGGGKLDVDAVMLESREMAVLLIKAAPDGSLVVVDGKPIGPVPLETRLSPGSHALVLQHHGYIDSNLPILLAAGEHRTLDVKLETPPPITAKWWFWTGVGVVVVTGVIVAVALVSDKPASTGTFTPGQVRGPLTLHF